MDGEEQSAVVAHYRSFHQLEAVMQKAEIDRIKRQQKGKS